jgi:hypothetical protein
MEVHMKRGFMNKTKEIASWKTWLAVFCSFMLVVGMMPAAAWGVENEAQLGDSETVAVDVNEAAIEPIFIRDKVYEAATFEKFEPDATERLEAVEDERGAGGYYENALVFLTVPGLEDVEVNDILTSLDTSVVAKVRAEEIGSESLQETDASINTFGLNDALTGDDSAYESGNESAEELPVASEEEAVLTTEDKVFSSKHKTVDDILSEFDVKVVSVGGDEKYGLVVEICFADESQKETLSELLLNDSRIVEVENSIFFSPAAYPSYISKVSVDTAWNTVQATSNIIVAVIDTGFQTSHSAFSGRFDTAHAYNSEERNTTKVGFAHNPIIGNHRN